jgi:phosphoribosylamine-glycine ligase
VRSNRGNGYPWYRKFSKEKDIDMVIVAPDDPLAAGMVDALEAEGIRAWGPDKKAAIIEASKAFSKELMKNIISQLPGMKCLITA